MTPKRDSPRGSGTDPVGKLTIEASRSRPPTPNSLRRTRVARIRFRFVLILIIMTVMSCGRAPLCLWTDSACGCADSANHIT